MHGMVIHGNEQVPKKSGYLALLGIRGHMAVRLGKWQGYLLPCLTDFSRGCRCPSGASSLPVAFLGPVVSHTTDPSVLQNAAALMHPFVAFELLHFALASLKIWAKLCPIPEGLGNTAWSELALTIVP